MIIYKITNAVNNKVYIGQTIQSLASRKGLHLFHLRNNKHPNRHLQFSFNRYTEENFIFEIIYNACNLQELNNKEKVFIEYYKSNDRNFGYNIREGGLNEKLSIEHKENISKALIGNSNGSFGKGKTKIRPININHNEKTKQKISNTLKGRKDYNSESIKKARESRLVKVEQYNLEGKYINTFNSILEASIETKANKSLISLCLSGKKKTAGGFIWKRKIIFNENITL